MTNEIKNVKDRFDIIATQISAARQNSTLLYSDTEKKLERTNISSAT